MKELGEIMSNIVRGTLLLTGASFLSKFLGMIYVIPFNELVGSRGGALYFYAYNPYSILISISTVGVPLAVSKFVARYNSLGDYATSMRMFRTGITIMTITGLLAFLTLYFSAESLAKQIITDDNLGNTVEDVKMVIRMVSYALLLIPAMSMVRGFFQGNESMGPTAVSQVIEQIVRIAFVLISAYVVINILDGSIASVVGFATFAAFIGALASCFVLAVYWWKRRKNFHKHIVKQKVHYELSTYDLIKELFQYAGPFVLVVIAIPLYQGVDQFTFNRAMVELGKGEIAELAFATINLYGHKLIIIPVTLATGLSLAIIPVLTKSFTNRSFVELNKQINQALQIIFILVIPAVVGLAMLSYEAYGSIYGLKDIAITSKLLAWSTPLSLLFALFTVSAAILQGINEQRYSVVSLLVGFSIKLLTNVPLIHLFGEVGLIIATCLAVGTAVIINFVCIKRSINFSFKETFKRTALVIILTAIMAIVLFVLKFIIGLMVAYETSRISTFIVLLLTVSIGGLVYLWLCYQTTLLERVFGSRVSRLNRFIRKI